jgi:hypothetical protein
MSGHLQVTALIRPQNFLGSPNHNPALVTSAFAAISQAQEQWVPYAGLFFCQFWSSGHCIAMQHLPWSVGLRTMGNWLPQISITLRGELGRPNNMPRRCPAGANY